MLERSRIFKYILTASLGTLEELPKEKKKRRRRRGQQEILWASITHTSIYIQVPISFPAEKLTSPVWDGWCHTRRRTNEDPRCLYDALQVGGKLLHSISHTVVQPWPLGTVLCTALGTSRPAKAPSEHQSQHH